MVLEKGSKCLLRNLSVHVFMNGELCKIVGSYRVEEDRYPVYVYKTKQTILIKTENLKLVKTKPKSQSELESKPKSIMPVICECQERILETILSHTKREKVNQAKLFANYLFKSNPENVFDTKLNHDLKYMLAGNCIYIPSFFNINKNDRDLTLFNYLMHDLKDANMDEKYRRLMVTRRDDTDKKRRKLVEDDISSTFKMISQSLADYFDVDMKYSVINLYRNGTDYASFHSDRYHPDEVDITIGASFGQKRDLSFLHKDTKQTFPIQQKNCDVFAFTSVINYKFKHSILKTNHKIGPRFSIIVWGKRRTLNAKNSSNFERMEMNEMNEMNQNCQMTE